LSSFETNEEKEGNCVVDVITAGLAILALSKEQYSNDVYEGTNFSYRVVVTVPVKAVPLMFAFFTGVILGPY
jgi:hypothetical protein